MTTPNQSDALSEKIVSQLNMLSNAILGFSGLLYDHGLDTTQKSCIAEIKQASKELSSLTGDMQYLSQIQTGISGVTFEKYSVDWLVDELEAILRPLTRQTGSELLLVKSGTLPGQLQTDPPKICRCLSNMTENAINACRDGQVTLTVSSADAQQRPSLTFEIKCLSDHLDGKKLKTMVDIINGRETKNTTFGSTELQLEVTRELTETLGASISTIMLKNEFAVSVAVPVEANIPSSPVTNIQSINSTIDQLGQASCSGNVLLIESDPLNSTVMSIMLEVMGMRVSTAQDSQNALNLAYSESFDMIIMDIANSRADSIKIAQKLRKNGITTPIIAIDEPAQNGQTPKSGDFDCVLTKPVDNADLFEVASKYLPAVNEVKQENTEKQAVVSHIWAE